MSIKGLMFTIVLVLSSAFTLEHPLKMSFSKLVISPEGKVEVETHIFLDDLTLHLEHLYGLQQADFSTIISDGTKALQHYLRNHFYFEQDGKKLDLWIHTVSNSKNGLAVVLKLSTTNPLDFSKEIFLTNTLLCDASSMQTNDIKYLGEYYNLSLGNPKAEIKIQFD
ncbi:MAG: DUF6702 family protein [Bacteroidota bacterium]